MDRFCSEISCNLAFQLWIIAFTTTLPVWSILVVFGLLIPAIALTLCCRGAGKMMVLLFSPLDFLCSAAEV